ncbi:ABC transporter permease [Anaerocolumna jejuensis]|uniref:ABC transporter permease n=1 Tax=Anaerocolumna jejuensis TaxID=259063 RepID=UPI003F7C15BA
MKRLKVIYYTALLQMKCSFARPMFRFCLIANPMVNTILLYEMFKSSGREDFASYVVLGGGLMALWSCICFSSAGDINRERYDGTLSLIYVAPAGFSDIVTGKVIGNTILSLATFILSFLTAKLLFRVDIKVSHPYFLLLAILCAVVSFSVISIVVAYLLTLSRKTQLYMNCIEIPVILVCGFVFPAEILPQWVRPVSYILSPTWAVKLIRISVSTAWCIKEFYTVLCILALVTAIYLVIGYFLLKLIESQVRVLATLEVS